MKKLNKKGFTLVELLAVIVILALLMVVLVPKAIEAINNSRANTFVEGYQAFINTVELKYAEGSLDNATCGDTGTGGDSTTCNEKYGLSTDYTATIKTDGSVSFSGENGRFKQANIDKFGTYWKETTPEGSSDPVKSCDSDKIQKGATDCYYTSGTGPTIEGKISF